MDFMDITGCRDLDCSYHERNDCALREPLGDSGIDDVAYATYLGEYAISTTLSLSLPQQMALRIASTIGTGRTEETRELFRNIFQDPTYITFVIKVDGGSLSDAVPDVEPVYSNTTSTADDAIELHHELEVMINAGTFNGADL